MRWVPALAIAALFAASGSAQLNELTAGYGNSRTNANLQETALTPATVKVGNFGKIGTLPVDGEVYAHPLYVSGLAIPGQGTHNVVFVLTMHNSVYAYDADSAASPVLLWHVNLGPSVPSNTFESGYTDITPEVGILSTGAIDLQRQALYIVSVTLSSGGSQSDAIVYHLHALDITTGAEVLNGPATIQASVHGTGAGSAPDGTLAFDPQMHLQRPGLLLANGAVYLGFGSHDDLMPWHGWLMSYSASNVSQQLSAQAITPNSYGGSIWQAGEGLAADESGNIYALSGNGFFDGTTEFSNGFLKFTGAAAQLSAWFAPPNWQMLAQFDYDVVAGPAIIPGTHLLVGGDKYGELYLVDGASLGTNPTGADGSAQVIMGVQVGGIFTLAVWNRTDGAYIYLQEQGTVIKCYQVLAGTLNPTPVSLSPYTGQKAPFDGLAISANGGQAGTGILWATTTGLFGGGTLHAFDATNLSNELWNSDMTHGTDALFSFAKFAVPTVINGTVYVPTWSNGIAVYGLTAATPPANPAPALAAVMNGASYGVGSVSPGEVVTIFGSNLGPAEPAAMEVDNAGFLTMLLSGTQVLFDGTPVPMIYTSPGQVSAVAPFGLQAATQIEVEYQGRLSKAFAMAVSPVMPGVFSLDGSGAGQALAFNQDGSLNSANNPAAAGSVIHVYATGLGQMSPAGQDGLVVTGAATPLALAAQVTAQIGGQPANVVSAGSTPGLIDEVVQLSITVPQPQSSAGAVSLVVKAGGQNSQPGITVAVHP
jgi:uncharacterized protein (TIGR03437 family)